MCELKLIITVRNSICGKIMFLHLSCQSFCLTGGGMHGREGAFVVGGVCGRGGGHGKGVCMAGGHACVAVETATAADGMHPTGMHSCFFVRIWLNCGSGEGVCLSACWDASPPGPGRQPPPGPGRPSRTRDPPRDQADTPPRPETPPREADASIRSMSGRYASYWNAFLFNWSIRNAGLCRRKTVKMT